MKTSGKILHNFTSLFRQSSMSHRRKAVRGSRLLHLESLETRQLLTVPALSSSPNAQMTVFLDFDGQDYGNQIVRVQTNPNLDLERMSAIPGFTIDGTPGPDSAAEERLIEEIFYRVAEDFRPFNVNVTTVQPPAGVLQIRVSVGGNGIVQYNVLTRVFDQNGQLIQIIVGPAQTYRFTSPVFAEVNAYRNNQGNPVLIFPQQLTAAEQNGQTIARLISQGVGRQLGLQNQPGLGTADSGPIMADLNANPIRDTWANSTGNLIQDDLARLTIANGIQQRADDFNGDTLQTAANASQDLVSSSVGTPVEIAKGIINYRPNAAVFPDRDIFRTVLDLTQTTGTAELSIDVSGLDLSTHTFRDGTTDATLNPGSNLDVVVNLYSANGTLLASDSPSPGINGQITFEIPSTAIPGNRLLVYYIEVTTTSEYGSLGEYTVECSLQEVLGAPVVLAPAGTVQTTLPTFSWTSSLRATGYVLEVSNATTGALVFRKTTSATTYKVDPEDSNVLPQRILSLAQGNYSVRVRSIRGAGGTNNESAWSNSVTFTIDVPLPSKPLIISPKTITGEAFPTFEWTKGAFDSGFTLQVFKKGTTTRVIYKTNLAQNKYVHFSPLANDTYTFNVRAYNAANEAGALSETVEFKLNSPLPVAPKLSAPAATTTSVKPRFIWNAVAGAAFYELKVDNLSTGVMDYIRQSRLTRTQTFFDPPTMTQGNYRAYVRGVSGDGTAGPWSAAHTFELNLLPPAAPSVTGPRGLNDSPTIQTTNPTFTWTVPVRGVKYDLLVNNLTTQTAGVIRQNGLKTTSFTAQSNLSQGSYRVWVRAYNAANEVGDWSAPFNFNIDEPTPSIPTVTGPAVNSLGYVENANPTFTWTVATPPASSYDITLYDVTLGKNVFFVSGLTQASYTVPTARRLTEHTYRVRVRAKNVSGDASEWSTSYQFRINIPDPTSPVIVAPGDTITDTTPTFSWRHSGTSFSYELLIRDLLRNEDITIQVKTFSLDPGGATASYTLPAGNALKTGTYRFWVRAFNSLGQASSWSNSKTFVITVQRDEPLNAPRGVNPDELAESQVVSALSGPSTVPVKVTENVAEAEVSPSPEYFVVVEPKDHGHVNVIPESPGEESLIDAFMHRIADPSADLDFTFLRS